MNKAPEVTYRVLRQMLEEIFKRNDHFHEELHKLIETLGKAENPDEVVKNWAPKEKYLVEICDGVEGVLKGHLVSNKMGCGQPLMPTGGKEKR